ncbi:MAG: chromate transporter [Bacillota bacterium]|jgi:chromate transporter
MLKHEEKAMVSRKADGVSLWALFWTFFRIGAFTIGGGYVMVPLIQRDVVDKNGWMSSEDFVDALAIVQAAPGPLAVNTAVYVGYVVRSYAGALASMAGCILPSILVILAVAQVFSQIGSIKIVEAAFSGIRPAVVVLILSAVINIGKPIIKSGPELALSAAAFALVAFAKLSPAVAVFAAALIGVIFRMGGDDS